MDAYLLLEFVLKLNELVEELGVDVFYATDALIMNLCLHVFLWYIEAVLLSTVNSFESLTLLKRRCVDILFLCQGECEDAVQESLEQLVQLLLLVGKQSFVNDIRNEFFLQNDQRVEITNLVEAIKENCPGRLQHLDQDVIVDVGHEMGHLVMSQIEAMELGLQVSAKPTELLLI